MTSFAERILATDNVAEKLDILAEAVDVLVGRKRAPCATPAPVSAEVDRVFEAWKRLTGRKQAKLVEARRRAVQARLADGYSAERIIRAVEGCAGSDFHMARGEYNGKIRYNDLTLICRNGAKLEEFEQMPAAAEDPLVIGLRRMLVDQGKWATVEDAIAECFAPADRIKARMQIRAHGGVGLALTARMRGAHVSAA